MNAMCQAIEAFNVHHLQQCLTPLLLWVTGEAGNSVSTLAWWSQEKSESCILTMTTVHSSSKL
jgi:hypothetical protein